MEYISNISEGDWKDRLEEIASTKSFVAIAVI